MWKCFSKVTNSKRPPQGGLFLARQSGFEPNYLCQWKLFAITCSQAISTLSPNDRRPGCIGDGRQYRYFASCCCSACSCNYASGHGNACNIRSSCWCGRNTIATRIAIGQNPGLLGITNGNGRFVRFGHRHDFSKTGLLHVILISRQSHSGQNADDRNNDHQLYQGEALAVFL